MVTRKEALRILGIRKGALSVLELAAKVRHAPGRDDYSKGEFRRLLRKLREILSHP